eukprot:scaffold317_cov260-Pinguiococcus_pyrenoidosus.AAC.12
MAVVMFARKRCAASEWREAWVSTAKRARKLANAQRRPGGSRIQANRPPQRRREGGRQARMGAAPAHPPIIDDERLLKTVKRMQLTSSDVGRRDREQKARQHCDESCGP